MQIISVSGVIMFCGIALPRTKIFSLQIARKRSTAFASSRPPHHPTWRTRETWGRLSVSEITLCAKQWKGSTFDRIRGTQTKEPFLALLSASLRLRSQPGALAN